MDLNEAKEALIAAGYSVKPKTMTQREAARKGGESKSPAKIAAVRKNLEKARAARRPAVQPRIPLGSRYAETQPEVSLAAKSGQDRGTLANA